MNKQGNVQESYNLIDRREALDLKSVSFLKLTIAYNEVEDLFPYRFITVPVYKGANSIQYRPSYIRAVEKLEALLGSATLTATQHNKKS